MEALISRSGNERTERSFENGFLLLTVEHCGAVFCLRNG